MKIELVYHLELNMVTSCESFEISWYEYEMF